MKKGKKRVGRGGGVVGGGEFKTAFSAQTWYGYSQH